MVLIVPIIPRGESGWALLVPLLIAGTGLGLLVSQLNNYILAPIAEERVSEAAGVNSAGQSFGLSFGLAVAGGLLLAVLSFTFVNMTKSSDVIPAADQDQIADVLEDHAQLISTTDLELLLERPTGRGPRRGRPRSTPTPATPPCRWPCSCRSSPACSGSSTRSASCASPTTNHRQLLEGIVGG